MIQVTDDTLRKRGGIFGTCVNSIADDRFLTAAVLSRFGRSGVYVLTTVVGKKYGYVAVGRV